MYLRMFCNHNQNDWDELLLSAEFACANHVHASTQVTPFIADTGRNPRMGFEPNVDVADEDAEAFRDRMQEGLEEAKAALVKAQDEYARVLQSTTATWLWSSNLGTWFSWMRRISGPIE